MPEQNNIVALALKENPWMHDEAEARGWRCLHLGHYDYVLPKGTLPRGLLVSLLPDDDRIKAFREMGIPIVRVGNFPHPEDEEMPAVIFDRPAAGRLAAEHFAERRFRQVCFFSNAPWRDNISLYENFSSRAKELGVSCHLEKHISRGGPQEARHERKRQQFLDWIMALPRPLGLFAPSPKWAIQYCIWMQRAGIDIPLEIAVIALGGRHSALEWAFPSISYVDMNDEGRLHTACDLLDDMMAGKAIDPGTARVPPAGVVQLESSNLLATNDEVATRAAHYIWSNFHIDLTVDDVAQQVAVSRRQLERRFKEALGRTINEEIRSRRLDEVKELLLATDLTVAEIGERVGFHSPNYLFRCFRRVFGMTPAQFRKKDRA